MKKSFESLIKDSHEQVKNKTVENDYEIFKDKDKLDEVRSKIIENIIQ